MLQGSGGIPGPSGGQASAQASKALSYTELKKKVAYLEEHLKVKKEEVTRLKAENESTLKEERDRIEMMFQEKMAKVETEKDALVKLVKTTKIKYTVLEEELKKAKKDVQGAEEDKKVLDVNCGN